MRTLFNNGPLALVMLMSTSPASCTPLASAPEHVARFSEIAIKYNPDIAEVWNKLSAPERVMVYYLFRASLPGHRISAMHHHRHALALIEMVEALLDNKAVLEQAMPNGAAFVSDLTTYWVYLWTNHGQYFSKEHAQDKRTPAKIGLKAITPQSLAQALEIIDYPERHTVLAALHNALFDANIEHTMTVPDSINQSAVGFYGHDFTDEDFEKLPADKRVAINAFCDVRINDDGTREPFITLCKIGGRMGQELAVSYHWIQQAHEHAKRYPHYFDAAFTESLNQLARFIKTGDEEDFKTHCISWLKSANRIDYSFGFIETYEDPKGYRGSFQAEVTCKKVDIEKLNAILPSIEKRLPVPEAFKREAIDTLPNASVNVQLFGQGGLGPLCITAAYCLPNYEEIRSAHGSKQIMYPAGKALGELINPEMYRTLFYLKEHAAWSKKHDPQMQLGKDIWTAHCTLHETLGHGSGRFSTHTFKEGDRLTIGGVTYNVGDTIDVTSDNIQELLCGYSSALEELRAEIIALYTSIFMFDELAAQGLFGDWPSKVSRDEMIDHLIFDMAATGLRRLQNQQRNTKNVAGAHDKANLTIMYYLIDGGGLKLVEENVTYEGIQYIVLGFNVVDRKQLFKDITDLLVAVQTIKSTGDGAWAQRLFGTYGDTVRDQRHIDIMKDNLAAIAGDLKVSAQLFPHLTPIRDENGIIVDINATWPHDIFEQAREFKRLEMSRE